MSESMFGIYNLFCIKVHISHLWSSCSSRCGGHPGPDRSRRSSSHYLLWPARSWLPGLCGYTAQQRRLMSTCNTHQWCWTTGCGRIRHGSGPSLMLGKPFLWPPGKQQKPAPWPPNWPEKLAWSCSSTPALLVYERGGNPAGSPLRRTPQAHREALETQVRISVCLSRMAAAAHARDRLTILCARSQQVDDVLMFADHLHHFHFRDEVSPVLLCGIRCTTRSHDISFIRMFYCGTLAGKLICFSPLSIFTATFVRRVGLFLSSPTASARTTWPKHPSPRGFPSVSLTFAQTADGHNYQQCLHS